MVSFINSKTDSCMAHLWVETKQRLGWMYTERRKEQVTGLYESCNVIIETHHRESAGLEYKSGTQAERLVRVAREEGLREYDNLHESWIHFSRACVFLPEGYIKTGHCLCAHEGHRENCTSTQCLRQKFLLLHLNTHLKPAILHLYPHLLWHSFFLPLVFFFYEW